MLSGGPPEYESVFAFLQDRYLDHATDATHRFEALSDGIEDLSRELTETFTPVESTPDPSEADGAEVTPDPCAAGSGEKKKKPMFAGLEDRRTREQDEFQDLAKHVGRYQDERVKVLEFLSVTFTLHFEITIYKGERSDLQSLVKAMTQEMLGGTKEMLAENSGGKSGTGGIWKMRELRTFLYAMPFKTEAGDVGIYAQAVYPDVTVSKHQHMACLRLLTMKLPELKLVQDLMRRMSGDHNHPHFMLKRTGDPNAPVPVPLTMHSVGNGPPDRLRPLFCVTISLNGVHKIPVPDSDPAWWCFNGLKRKDLHSEQGREHEWNQPDFGPKGKTKSGADRSSSGTTSTPDPVSASQSTPSQAS